MALHRICLSLPSILGLVFASTFGSAGCSSDSPGGSTGPASSGASSGGSSGAASGASSGASSGAGSGASSGSTTATVSFSKDIVPIFQKSCNTPGVSCHSDPTVATNGLASGGDRSYLGASTGSVDATTVLKGIVGKPSFEAPSMNVITAGDPTKSYLMFKMDGQLSGLSSACQSGDLGLCGALMPFGGSTPLPQATRDLVRSWITQGAKNN